MQKERKNDLESQQTDGHLQCPDCGGFRIKTIFEDHAFTYGVGENALQITAKLPFRHCQKCGLRFLDDEGEKAMHEAVCRHLGVMSPDEIKQLRERYGMSRQEFARLTKLGEATIARWERGALIQNAGNDQLLYLLTFPENVERLRSRRRDTDPPKQENLQNEGVCISD